MDRTDLETSPGNQTEAYVVPFHHRAVVASFLIGLTLIGLFGNALVIISVGVGKKLHTITNILVVNLAVADFVSCSCLPFLSAGLLSQSGSYPLPKVVCAAVAGVMYTSVCCSGSTLVAIAFVRWYVITRSIRGHQGIHTPKKITSMALMIWIQSVALMVVPPLLGVGTLGYSEYYCMCFVEDTNKSAIYYIILQGTLIATGLTLTLIFYVLILRHVLRHNRLIRNDIAVAEHTGSDAILEHRNKASSKSRGNRAPKIVAINQMEVKITMNLFTIVCVFILCFLATVVNYSIPGTSVLTLYGYIIVMVNSVVNPIIYGFKHPNFREVFKNILGCRRLALNQAQPDIIC